MLVFTVTLSFRTSFDKTILLFVSNFFAIGTKGSKFISIIVRNATLLGAFVPQMAELAANKTSVFRFI